MLHLLEATRSMKGRVIVSDPGDEQEFIYSKVFLSSQEVTTINHFCDQKTSLYQDILDRNDLPPHERKIWENKIKELKHLKEKIKLGMS